jgi:hypothetical protein
MHLIIRQLLNMYSIDLLDPELLQPSDWNKIHLDGQSYVPT